MKNIYWQKKSGMSHRPPLPKRVSHRYGKPSPFTAPGSVLGGYAGGIPESVNRIPDLLYTRQMPTLPAAIAEPVKHARGGAGVAEGLGWTLGVGAGAGVMVGVVQVSVGWSRAGWSKLGQGGGVGLGKLTYFGNSYTNPNTDRLGNFSEPHNCIEEVVVEYQPFRRRRVKVQRLLLLSPAKDASNALVLSSLVQGVHHVPCVTGVGITNY